MSESSPADTNAEPSPVGDDAKPAPAKPGSDTAKPATGATQKVSEEAQENAAKDREEGGGYT